MADAQSAIREELWAKYGRPAVRRGSQAGDVLRALRLRDSLHPRDCVVGVYPSMEAAEAFAAANREHWGHEVIGPAVANGDVVDVVDLRPSMAKLSGWAQIDPALPDEESQEVSRG